jgi:Protein of unknown function (DUF2628)
MADDAHAVVTAPREQTETSPVAFLAYAQDPGYVEKWRGLIAGTHKLAGFNLYAAVFGTAWFFYRKMYGLGAAVFVAGVIVSFTSAIAYARIVRPPVLDNTRLTLVGLVSVAVLVRIPIGAVANVLYYKKAAKAVREAAVFTIPSDYLKARGGVSFGSALLAVVVGVAFTMLTQTLVAPSHESSSRPDAPRPTANTTYRDASVIRDGVYVNEVVGIELQLPDTYQTMTYAELKAQWEQSQRTLHLDLSKEERKLVKNQFHSDDILNLQVRPGAPAYANLRIIATPQLLHDGKPLTAREQATGYAAEFRHNLALGNVTARMKSEGPERVSKGGREYYMLRGAIDLPSFPVPIAELFLFTTHNGYSLTIIIAAMKSEDAEFLSRWVERIKYATPQSQ